MALFLHQFQKKNFFHSNFIIPIEELAVKYNLIASEIDNKIEILDSQIKLLTEARDRLLPKLMSGEIEL